MTGKKIIILLLLLYFCFITNGQPKEFEGVITYKTVIKSKIPGTSDRAWKAGLILDDSYVSFIKKGNFRNRSSKGDFFYLAQKQKLYIKLRGIDTLFYIDYASDTNTVINIRKTGEEKKIAGLGCKAITIRTHSSTTQYFYSPSLYMNPGYNSNNKLSRYDVFAKETSSLWLASTEEHEEYVLSNVAVGVEEKPVTDSLFVPPAYPEREFTYNSIVVSPVFTSRGGWAKYLQSNLNAEVATKYLKIQGSDTSRSEKVLVQFVVSETGRIENVMVVNKNEVHPKLAQEAIRVITNSPNWKPATILGEKVRFVIVQPVTFTATR
ncbi:MAG TPA: energy transducer TonB [Chitinophagaceae bacterium]|nr:energy transducer TonB [Chitinophagaceae bacterium]